MVSGYLAVRCYGDNIAQQRIGTIVQHFLIMQLLLQGIGQNGRDAEKLFPNPASTKMRPPRWTVDLSILVK